MPKTLISLVSRQPMPNYIGYRVIQPDRMAYLFTRQEHQTLRNLQRVIRLPSLQYEVEAFDFLSVEGALQKLLADCEGDEIILNITGGTKIMALAAFSVVRQVQGKIIYVNTDENSLVHLDSDRFQTEPLKNVVDVPTYLALHGQNMIGSGKPLFPHLSYTIASQLRYLKRLLLDFRRLQSAVGYRILRKLTPSEVRFIKILTNVDGFHWDSETSTIYCKNKQLIGYLAGNWLEEFVHQRLKKLKPDDLHLNVRISWELYQKTFKNEFDVMMILRNRLYIFECKSGNTSLDDINKLESLRAVVGGTYGKAYYVAASALPKSVKDRIVDFPGVALLEEKNLMKKNWLEEIFEDL
ncbi:MAG: hypothetical protein Kow0037_18250 [Calditrichia bacterium]